MKNSTRKGLRLGLPLFVAALYSLQTLIDYRETGEVSWLFLGAVPIFLVLFVLLWHIERQHDRKIRSAQPSLSEKEL